MKNIVQSKTFWLAVGQAVIASIGIFENSYPTVGWLLLVKSVLDVVLRTFSTGEVKFVGGFKK